MIFLKNDYSLGAHPQVFQALAEQNLTPSDSYKQIHSAHKRQSSCARLQAAPGADVHFIVGGT